MSGYYFYINIIYIIYVKKTRSYELIQFFSHISHIFSVVRLCSDSFFATPDVNYFEEYFNLLPQCYYLFIVINFFSTFTYLFVFNIGSLVNVRNNTYIDGFEFIHNEML